tara:strand:+ start:2907 stop:3263 length:357 start_codon:yes stop_codon:yes gene_type:complete
MSIEGNDDSLMLTMRVSALEDLLSSKLTDIDINVGKIMTALVGPNAGLDPTRPGLIVKVELAENRLTSVELDCGRISRIRTDVDALMNAKKTTAANWQTVVSIISALAATAALLSMRF